jgi:hypothetical protein
MSSVLIKWSNGQASFDGGRGKNQTIVLRRKRKSKT